MSEIVAKYHGVNVIKSCGYYYPEVNGDVECKSIKEVKEWIENIWLFTQNNIYQLADKMNLPRNLVWNRPANINSLLAAVGDVEIVDINNIPEDFGLLYTKEAEYQMEMIKQYDDGRYSHLSKKEREADIQPIRNSKDNPKIGRNELCPCGSGKKYKRCCLSSCR